MCGKQFYNHIRFPWNIFKRGKGRYFNTSGIKAVRGWIKSNTAYGRNNYSAESEQFEMEST